MKAGMAYQLVTGGASCMARTQLTIGWSGPSGDRRRFNHGKVRFDPFFIWQ